MGQSSSIWSFHRLGLLDRLDGATLEALLKEGRQERWGHHAAIHHDLQEDEIVAIVRGGVHTRGRSSQSPILRAGDLFGAAAQGEQAEGLVAEDDTVLVSLPRERFDALVDGKLGKLDGRPAGWRGPRVALPLASLLYTSPVQRLARALRHIGLEHAQQRDGGLWLPVRWDQPRLLAPWLGLTVAALKSGLEQVVDQGGVETLRRGLLLRDEEALERMADQNS